MIIVLHLHIKAISQAPRSVTLRVYKRLKQWVEIENFSGKSVVSVKQDFYAKILAANLTHLISTVSEEIIKKNNRNTQVNYKINMAQAISKMKHRIVAIISNHRQREKLINRAINYISLTIEAVRKGRSAPRKSNNINNKVHYMAYKSSFIISHLELNLPALSLEPTLRR